jgi:hypothetical protein
MKQFFLFTAIAAVVFAGCNKGGTDTPLPPEPDKTEYTITVSAGEGGTAEATINGSAVAKAVAATEITITASPDDGYEFAGWIAIGVTPVAETASTTFTMPARNVNIEAEFSKIIVPPTEYDITVSAGTGGTAEATIEGAPASKATADTEITLTATPDEGYLLKEWSATGVTLVNTTSLTVKFAMPENAVSISAEFTVDPATVDEGIVINGVKWATRNIDAPGRFAATPESPGMFYQWNRRTGWSVKDPLVSSPAGKSWDATNALGDEWTRENDPSPKGWRLPRVTHFKALLDKDKVERLLIKNTNGALVGVRFTDIETGNTIYFPTPGERDGATGNPGRNSNDGFYYSREKSIIFPDYCTNMLLSDGLLSAGGNNFRNFGYSARPVAEE